MVGEGAEQVPLDLVVRLLLHIDLLQQPLVHLLQLFIVQRVFVLLLVPFKCNFAHLLSFHCSSAIANELVILLLLALNAAHAGVRRPQVGELAHQGLLDARDREALSCARRLRCLRQIPLVCLFVVPQVGASVLGVGHLGLLLLEVALGAFESSPLKSELLHR